MNLLPRATSLVFLMLCAGCGGHTARTLAVRTQLNAGRPQQALVAINRALEVQSDTAFPAKLEGDNALLVLDRASIKQSLGRFAQSSRDLEAVDKAVEMLDFSRNAGDELGKYLFSDSSGRYKAPPYEKLLINVMNMINYLAAGDLNGAEIEARRFTVMQNYFRDKLKEKDNGIVSLGGFLAGYVNEKQENHDEALRYYDEALAAGSYRTLDRSVAGVLSPGSYKTPALNAAADRAGSVEQQADTAELLLVIGQGRIPNKIDNRVPIGVALSLVANAIRPDDMAAANRLAAKGLLTWVNFPSLAEPSTPLQAPFCTVDGNAIPLDRAVHVGKEVRKTWEKVQPTVILSAITRLITRHLASEGTEAALGGARGLLTGLALQVTLAAMDTPDTRSWEALPEEFLVARIKVPAGHHKVFVMVRGVPYQQEINLPQGGWKVIPFLVLR